VRPPPAAVVEREVRARVKPYSGFLHCRNSGPWAGPGALTLSRMKSERLVPDATREAITNEVHTLLGPFVMRHEVVHV
jgi:hypothetical protein